MLPDEEKIDLIKLDAEGFEPFILKGAARTLERSPSCAVMIELGMERWERFARLEDLVPLCGGQGRERSAVHDDGTIEKFDGDLRAFLSTRPFHENYFLVGHDRDIRTHAGRLLK